MDKQAIFKKDWIFRMIDKAHDQGLVISPDIIASIYNIPEKRFSALIAWLPYTGGFKMNNALMVSYILADRF
jgi:hypothetical protein